MKQLLIRAVKFICSSLLSFVIDLLLYKLLLSPLGDVLANICARVVSASFNFTVNRQKKSASSREADLAIIIRT